LIHFREWWLAIFGKANHAGRTSHLRNIDENLGDRSIEIPNETTIRAKRGRATEQGCPHLDQIDHGDFTMTNHLNTYEKGMNQYGRFPDTFCGT
jgi:hypothetical protein